MKALLVGINKYNSSPLSGCVNDIISVREKLIDDCGVSSSKIRVLTDERATKSAIVDRIRWLLSTKEDKVLFYYSGHGSYLPNRDPDKDYEYTGNDQLICPVDFNWEKKYILDDYLYTLYKTYKHPSTEMTVVFDSCHSESAFRGIQPMIDPLTGTILSYRKAKSIIPPMDIKLRDENFRGYEKNYKPVFKPKVKIDIPKFKHISGCLDTQTSSDAYLGGRYCGALSNYLMENWTRNIPVKDLIKEVVENLEANDFSQTPQLNYSDDANLACLF